MKKYLLFALVALVSITAGAQTLGRKSLSVKMAQERQIPVREMVKIDIPSNVTKKVHGQKMVAGRQLPTTTVLSQQLNPLRPVQAKQVTLNSRELRSMTPLRQVRNLAPRRAAAVKNVYHGTGIDYDFDDNNNPVQTQVKWDMFNGQVEFEDNTTADILFNVVPTPAEFVSEGSDFENGFFYQYTVEGNTLTIPAQGILSYQAKNGNTYYLFLMAANPQTAEPLDDGSIKMTIGDDGSLAVANTSLIEIGVFSSDTFSVDTFLGFYQLTFNVEYRFDGQIDPMPEGVTATAQFDAYGTNSSTNADETWTLWQGEKVEGSKTTPVLVNVIPTPSLLKADNPNGIAIPYTQSGNTITIQPVKVGEYKGKGQLLPWHLFLFGLNNQDGSINLTVGEDGSLNTIDGQAILIGAYSKNAFEHPNTATTWKGAVVYYKDVKYMLPGAVPAPMPEYEPEGVYLNAEFTPSLGGYSVTFTYVPAYAPLTFTNYTTTGTADSFSWKMDVMDVENQELIVKDVLTGTDRDFSITTQTDEYFNIPELVAGNQGVESKPYSWGYYNDDPNYICSSLIGQEEKGTADDEKIIYTKASVWHNRIYDDAAFGTPDVNSEGDKITRLVFYQGKPATPLYFEGVNLLVSELKNYDNLSLKCQIVKATRLSNGSIELGDVIAEGITTKKNVVAGYQENGWDISQLNWTSFYTIDELGLTQPIEILQVEDEFAIVIDGWNNGTFSCIPSFEGYCAKNGLVSTFLSVTGDEQYSEDDLLYYPGDYTHAYVGFINPIYGYLHTEDETTLTLPVEGGTAKLHVIPMLVGTDEDTGQPATGLWDEEEIDEEYEFPDWIEWDTENDTYTQDESSFDLVLKVKALPEGVEGRTATLNFYQWGAKLTVVVNQGEVSGITVTTATVRTADGKSYSLDGRRVLKDANGVVIRNGRKFISK